MAWRYGPKSKGCKSRRSLDNDGVNKLAEDKRATRKLINKYDFFLKIQNMPVLGKSLGQLLDLEVKCQHMFHLMHL